MDEVSRFDQLPQECYRSVLNYLPFAEVGLFMLLSRDLYTVSRSNTVWNTLYYRKWPGRMNRGGYRSQEPIGTTDWISRFRSRLFNLAKSVECDRWRSFNEATRDFEPISERGSTLSPSKSHSTHACDPNVCTFTHTGSDDFRCDSSGVVHICEPCRDGFACVHAIESISDSLWVCPISARTFQYPRSGYTNVPILTVAESSESETDCCKRSPKRPRR